MNYEQKYNEVLERAKEELRVCGSQDCDAAKQIFRFFPELKESEDERIRVGIIALLKFGLEDGSAIAPGFNETKEQALAWLEKQGEQKPNPYSGTSFEYNGHIWGMCARDNGVEILFDGELKAFLSLEKSFIYPIYPKSDLANKSDIEAIKDNVDNNNKVEPKFHPGDWITDGYIYYKIKEILDDRYIIESKYDKRSAILFEYENRYHLWTIEDAKDGDVLVASDGSIFLFAGIVDCGCKYYVALTSDNYVVINKEVEGVWETSSGAHPATKEQCDLLFAKMKEAGYGCDNANHIVTN